MKKKKMTVLLGLLILLTLMAHGILGKEPIFLWMNGDYVKSDVPPIIENNRTLVPVRVISESLGYQVQWNEEAQTVFISAPGEGKAKQITLTISKKEALILNLDNPIDKKSQTMNLDVAPKIINGRTFVPLRFIAEEFGVKVDWDQQNRTVVIGSGYVPPKTPPTSLSMEEENQGPRRTGGKIIYKELHNLNDIYYSGPIKITVTGIEKSMVKNMGQSEFHPDNRPAIPTIVLHLKVENTSNEEIIFSPEQLKATVNHREVQNTNLLLSDHLGGDFSRRSQDWGKIVVHFDTHAEDITHVKFSIKGACTPDLRTIYDEVVFEYDL